jgi:hypothetical protein
MVERKMRMKNGRRRNRWIKRSKGMRNIRRTMKKGRK